MYRIINHEQWLQNEVTDLECSFMEHTHHAKGEQAEAEKKRWKRTLWSANSATSPATTTPPRVASNSCANRFEALWSTSKITNLSSAGILRRRFLAIGYPIRPRPMKPHVARECEVEENNRRRWVAKGRAREEREIIVKGANI